jgi:hypothetical protein
MILNLSKIVLKKKYFNITPEFPINKNIIRIPASEIADNYPKNNQPFVQSFKKQTSFTSTRMRTKFPADPSEAISKVEIECSEDSNMKRKFSR